MANKLSLVLLVALAIFNVLITSSMVMAQRPQNAADVWEFLEAHNEARASVGVEPLTWSLELANLANSFVSYQSINNGCQTENLPQNKFQYGYVQNTADHQRPGTRWAPRGVVEWWVKQKQFYNHDDNSCAPNQTCLGYTQVVWRQSLQVGCAQAQCVDQQSSLTACFYNPRGNIVGQSPY